MKRLSTLNYLSTTRILTTGRAYQQIVNHTKSIERIHHCAFRGSDKRITKHSGFICFLYPSRVSYVRFIIINLVNQFMWHYRFQMEVIIGVSVRMAKDQKIYLEVLIMCFWVVVSVLVHLVHLSSLLQVVDTLIITEPFGKVYKNNVE